MSPGEFKRSPRRFQARRRRPHPIVGWRRVVGRHPRWYWAGVVALVMVSFWSTRARSAQIGRDRAAWGTTVATWCARRAITPGDDLPRLAYRCEVPAALAPDSAVGAPHGVAAQYIDADSVITAADVASDDGPLGLAPDGWVAVTVVESVPSGATTGEPVMLTSDGIIVTGEAIVVDRADDSVLIAVPRPAAAAVAAGSDGAISVVRIAPRSAEPSSP